LVIDRAVREYHRPVFKYRRRAWKPPGRCSDDKPLKWLDQTLANIGEAGDAKALVIGTHHPPYSSGGHSPSAEMLDQIDQVCKRNRVAPHAMLTGHSHNYQRYTRQTNFGAGIVQIPYIVAGCGGHAESQVIAAHKQKIGEIVFESSMRGYALSDADGESRTVDQRDVRHDQRAQALVR
jgi:3',5'-cyclic AMP phosphodiesterase CpdA